MAKQFLANRSGQTPTLDEVPNEVIKIYDDKAAADLDLANIEENEIVATKAGESEGVVEVVDTVEENNPNAVSSGAVYSFSAPKYPSAFNGRTAIATVGSFTQITLDTEGWYCMRTTTNSSASFGYIGAMDGGTTIPLMNFRAENNSISGFTIYLKAGNYVISGSNATLFLMNV